MLTTHRDTGDGLACYHVLERHTVALAKTYVTTHMRKLCFAFDGYRVYPLATAGQASYATPGQDALPRPLAPPRAPPRPRPRPRTSTQET